LRENQRPIHQLAPLMISLKPIVGPEDAIGLRALAAVLEP
jgi:hypothetical protein